MPYTEPTTPASPGRAFFDLPFRPLTAIPSPMRLALCDLAADLFRGVALGMFLLAVPACWMLARALAQQALPLPSAVGAVLVTCFGAGFVGYAVTKARGFGGGW